jgi:hypothetical protein
MVGSKTCQLSLKQPISPTVPAYSMPLTTLLPFFSLFLDQKRMQGFGRKPERNITIGRLSTDETITLKWILWKYNRREWAGFIWLRMGTSDWPLLNMTLNFHVS